MNKVAALVQLRFDVRSSPSLEADVKERLIQLAGSHVTAGGREKVQRGDQSHSEV